MGERKGILVLSEVVMSSGPPNGARSKARKGKRALADVEPSAEVAEPTPKRVVGENNVKLGTCVYRCE